MSVSITVLRGKGSSTRITVPLGSTTDDLKQAVGQRLQLGVDAFKLLVRGKTLQAGVKLAEQNVKDGSRVLLVTVDTGAVAQARRAGRVAKVTKAAETLAKRTQSQVREDQQYFEIENQAGESVALPDADRKALIVGMTLHEKGRARMSKEEWNEALEYLTEADAEFAKCDAKTLAMVDNYALLNLDLCWVYFKLQNPSLLSEAERRLQIVQTSFERAHGPNMERARALRGGFAPETILYIRLWLLQGVLAFHSKQRAAASALLRRASDMLASVSVSDDSLAAVMAMGFTRVEAMRALRTSRNDVANAAVYATEQREVEKRRQQLLRERRRHARLGRKHGRTANGKAWVDGAAFEQITRMGFDPELVAEGLRQTNNNGQRTVELLTGASGLLRSAVAARKAAQAAAAPYDPSLVTDDMVQQVAAMGFSVVAARGMLLRTQGNVQAAVDKLLAMPKVDEASFQATIDQAEAATPRQSTSAAADAAADPAAATTPGDAADDSPDLDPELEEELLADLPEDENAYLDVKLDDEGAAIADYLSRLAGA